MSLDHYRLYFQAPDGGFCGVEDFDAGDDAEAIALARRSVEASPHQTGELWQQARRVAALGGHGSADSNEPS